MTGNDRPTGRGPRTRRARTMTTAGLLLALVATGISGCVFVPVPVWDGGYHHHHHGYYYRY